MQDEQHKSQKFNERSRKETAKERALLGSQSTLQEGQGCVCDGAEMTSGALCAGPG